MDNAEKTLLIASAGYSRSSNVSLTKIAWALSAVMQKPENNIYHKLKEIDNVLDSELKSIYGVRQLSNQLDQEEQEDLFDDTLESKVGEIVDVEILSVKTFGAVCKVEDSTRTLLLHVSEVADQFIDDVRKYLKEGDRIKAMLILNPKGALGLSTRKIKSVSSGEDDYRQLYQQKEMVSNE